MTTLVPETDYFYYGHKLENKTGQKMGGKGPHYLTNKKYRLNFYKIIKLGCFEHSKMIG